MAEEKKKSKYKIKKEKIPEFNLSPKIERLQKQMDKDPASKVFLPLSEEYRKSKMPEEAIYFLKEGLKHNPNYLQAKIALARVCLEVSDIQEAKKNIDEVLEVSPNNFLALKISGDIYIRDGDFNEARTALQQALKLNPMDPEVQGKLRDIGATGDRAKVEVATIDDSEGEMQITRSSHGGFVPPSSMGTEQAPPLPAEPQAAVQPEGGIEHSPHEVPQMDNLPTEPGPPPLPAQSSAIPLPPVQGLGEQPASFEPELAVSNDVPREPEVLQDEQKSIPPPPLDLSPAQPEVAPVNASQDQHVQEAPPGEMPDVPFVSQEVQIPSPPVVEPQFQEISYEPVGNVAMPEPEFAVQPHIESGPFDQMPAPEGGFYTGPPTEPVTGVTPSTEPTPASQTPPEQPQPETNIESPVAQIQGGVDAVPEGHVPPVPPLTSQIEAEHQIEMHTPSLHEPPVPQAIPPVQSEKPFQPEVAQSGDFPVDGATQIDTQELAPEEVGIVPDAPAPERPTPAIPYMGEPTPETQIEATPGYGTEPAPSSIDSNLTQPASDSPMQPPAQEAEQPEINFTGLPEVLIPAEQKEPPKSDFMREVTTQRMPPFDPNSPSPFPQPSGIPAPQPPGEPTIPSPLTPQPMGGAAQTTAPPEYVTPEQEQHHASPESSFPQPATVSSAGLEPPAHTGAVKPEPAPHDNYNVELAELYEKQGFYDKAIEVYRALIEREPDNQLLVTKLVNAEKKKQNINQMPGAPRPNPIEGIAKMEEWFKSVTTDQDKKDKK